MGNLFFFFWIAFISLNIWTTNLLPDLVDSYITYITSKGGLWWWCSSSKIKFVFGSDRIPPFLDDLSLPIIVCICICIFNALVLAYILQPPAYAQTQTQGCE